MVISVAGGTIAGWTVSGWAVAGRTIAGWAVAGRTIAGRTVVGRTVVGHANLVRAFADPRVLTNHVVVSLFVGAAGLLVATVTPLSKCTSAVRGDGRLAAILVINNRPRLRGTDR